MTSSTPDQLREVITAVAALEPSTEGYQDYQVKTLSIDGKTILNLIIGDIRATAAYVRQLREEGKLPTAPRPTQPPGETSITRGL